MTGLDRLIDFILGQLQKIIPIVVVHQYQNAALYTYGRYTKILKPGWHFKFPYINTVAFENVIDTTILLPAQSVRSVNGEEFIIRGVVGYKVIKVDKYFNNVYDVKSA